MAEKEEIQGYRPLRSITRLLVGGLILGTDALQGRLESWETQEEPEDLPEVIDAETQKPLEFDPLPESLPPPGLTVPSKRVDSDLRYALIGLIFEGEEQLEKGLALTKRIGSFAGRIIDPFVRPITKIPNPAASRFDRLVQRGQSEVDSWISRGREEEFRSRQMAQEAATSTVDESITYMAQNPALEELVQTQSVSLAKQILELVRSDAVSADYFFEGLVRYAFARKPRYLLPPPSPEVQEQATWNIQSIRHEDL